MNAVSFTLKLIRNYVFTVICVPKSVPFRTHIQVLMQFRISMRSRIIRKPLSVKVHLAVCFPCLRTGHLLRAASFTEFLSMRASRCAICAQTRQKKLRLSALPNMCKVIHHIYIRRSVMTWQTALQCCLPALPARLQVLPVFWK